MSKTPNYVKEVQELLANIHESRIGDQDNEPRTPGEPQNEYDLLIEEGVREDRITLIPKRIHGMPVDEQYIIDSVTIPHEEPFSYLADHPTIQAMLQKDEQEKEPPAQKPLRAVDRLGYGVIIFYLLLIVSTLFFELYQATIQPSATITLVSTETPVMAHAAINLPAHVFTAFTFSQSQTAPTTGRTHQNATYATGYVTFYNALTQQQTIDAGTLLTGADGTQIVTDQIAYVPAGAPPNEGEVTVSAHAVNAGPSGNINAGDINGTCCREYILVKNTNPFTGGQNERDYQSVAKADIQNVVSNLSRQFQQTLQEKTTSLVAASETLITPIPCTSNMQSDHAAGAEATQVTVTLHETCTPVAYNTNDFKSQANHVLSQAVTQTYGTGYSLLGNVETSIEKTTLQKSSILFTVVCSGMWAHAFNVHQLATLIKGKSQQEATMILQKQNGIAHLAMQVSGTKNNTLPTDTAQIHFTIFYEPV